MPGKLVLVGTPLGNAGDLSPRALEAIRSCDLLLCEDTRSPVRLVGEGVRLPKRLSCFIGNERARVGVMLERVGAGETVAFVSEAGMPGWSDPGADLVRAAVQAGYEVDVVPGPTAATTALAHAGLPAIGARFVGFPPRDGRQRTEVLTAAVGEAAATIFYEAGNRVHKLLTDLAALAPDADRREVVVARELTKMFQEVTRGPLRVMVERTPSVRGEVTVVLAGTTAELEDPAQRAARQVVDAMLDTNLKPREKAKRLAAVTGWDANTLYKRLAEK